MEVLIGIRRLERLDKDEYSEEERQEAEEIYEQRRAEELAAEVRTCPPIAPFTLPMYPYVSIML